jgi:protein involved in polysaccharide export with SLBB domain
MPTHLQPLVLRPFSALSALAMAACLVFSLPALAQLPALPATAASATGALADPALAGALPGAAAAPTVRPILPARPDLGAADAYLQPAPQRVRKPQAPSQFQRFVQESTGRLLPHFGAELFDNLQAYATDAAAPAPAEYVLGQGDEVRIQIWGSVDYAGSHTLDRNGQINLPKIGTLNLSGVQVKDLEASLRKRVATVFNNVTLTASLGKLRGITVYVVGQAQQPGTYNLSSLSTLVNAVFASGGPGVNGSMRGIQLKRAGQTITTLDLYDFIAQGDKSKDARLQPGDVIMIPPAGPRIALTGATDHGAIYEFKPGQAVQDILALGGGVPALASTQKALVERIDAAQSAAPRQVQNLVLNAQGLALPLKDGDVLTLLPISPAFGNAVTLQGTVAQPLRNAWFPGMRVQDLIPDREALITPDYYRRKNQLVQNPSATLKAQGLTPAQIQAIEKAQQQPESLALATEIITGAVERGLESRAGSTVSDRVRNMVDQINWDYALIERLNKTDLRTELVPFNLGKAVVQKDPAHNLLLQAGDVITITGSNDLQLPSDRNSRLVRVEGEVVAPGVYQVRPGETLPQLLLRAGGVMPQAYIYGLEFTRESVRKQQQQNLDQVIRRLEGQMQSSGATLAANLTGERAASVQALQQQQQQQQQSQIARLKALKSKGRVSLELDPAAGESAKPLHQRRDRNTAADFEQLPHLPLEDGDAILVPSLPSFVSAVGSVSNENVMIYKAGKTVGDILKSASLTDDADASGAFLLRADGSVFGRRAAGFFSSFESTKVMPGDTLIVPARVDRESGYNFLVRALRDWTQIFSNLGIGAAAIKTLKN